MTEAVLDASVILKWFRSEDERHLAAARSLRTAFEAEDLLVFAPPLLRLEIGECRGTAMELRRGVARRVGGCTRRAGLRAQRATARPGPSWTARGLTAYDAAYVALAEAEALPLITDDDRIVTVAPQIAIALRAAARDGS